MHLQGSVARAESSARGFRPSHGSGDDSTVENARLRRELVRLQAVCDEQETNLLRLSRALWELRQQGWASESRPGRSGW